MKYILFTAAFCLLVGVPYSAEANQNSCKSVLIINPEETVMQLSNVGDGFELGADCVDFFITSGATALVSGTEVKMRLNLELSRDDAAAAVQKLVQKANSGFRPLPYLEIAAKTRADSLVSVEVKSKQ